MPPYVDYHTHTTFSCDARDTLDAMCRQAIAIGLQEICFTEHADFEPADSCTSYFEPEPYFAAIEAAREQYGAQLMIRTGVEIGEPHRYPAETAALLDKYPFDFVLGSLHWVDGYPGFSAKFFEGRTREAGWRSYFEELVRLCEAGDFDVLSHLDLPKRHIDEFDPEPYAELTCTALQHLIARGMGIEINCSGLRHRVGEPLPGPAIIRWYRELGGEILTVGTDSHKVADLGQGLDVALAMAREAGFEALSVFEARRPHQIYQS
jgi:histidinol-phosphatase (PHP family)